MLGLLSPSSISWTIIAVISRMHGEWWESSIGVTSTLEFLGLTLSSLATSSSAFFSVNSSNGVWGIAYLGSVGFLLEDFMWNPEIHWSLRFFPLSGGMITNVKG